MIVSADEDVRQYSAILVQQTPLAPPFYLTAVSAEGLLEWCDVPRSKSDYMAGYQRALSRRHEDIAKYFRAAEGNITPGAVIIAVDSDHVDIQHGDDSTAVLSIAPDRRDFETKLLEHFGSLSQRLSDEELESASIDFSSAKDEDAEENIEDLADEPTSYLAVLAAELKQAVTDFSSLDIDRATAIRDYIEGTSKPGLIIDGQHRVFGAKSVNEFPVMLPVVIIPGLPHSEQVFHFYVLNSKAKPLRKTELRRIISTSLTDAEIHDLYERFDQAGVEAHEARWTFKIHTRDDSVFKGLINFGFGNPGEVIPENVADQVLKAFVRMSKSSYGGLISPIKAKWEDTEYRVELFLQFWRAIAQSASLRATWADARTAAYGTSPVQMQIFRKVSLLTLQRFVLDKLSEIVMFQDEEASPFNDEDRLQKLINKILENLPGEFFEKEWKLKQIDTSQGHEDLYNEMEKVYKNRGKVDGRSRLFRG